MRQGGHDIPEDAIRRRKEAHANNLRALNALRRAAIEARRKAIETDGYVLTWRNGEMVYDTEVNPCCHNR